jgi:hypothetical protein
MGILRDLASWPHFDREPKLRYVEERQISYVKEDGDWIESWEARSLEGTKKFDVETGEDAKGQ